MRVKGWIAGVYVTMLGVFMATAVLISVSPLYAWNGDQWATISRDNILKTAGEMVNATWRPNITVSHWAFQSGNKTQFQIFKTEKLYTGEVYSQNNPQENLSEFLQAVTRLTGVSYAGNDCSGFVSIAWRLPQRYTTRDFVVDANAAGGYVSNAGVNIATGGLLPGDALVTDGHMIIFHEYIKTKNKITGIWAYEQTYWVRGTAVRTNWTLSKLKNYVPIRRNNL